MESDRSTLDLRGLTKSYGGTTVLNKFNLTVRDGEFLMLLGPSGSGKTTVLRLIGGFIAPSEGRIFLDEKDITEIPVNRRPFNTVFQDYALFPHLTVAQNVGYGLMVRGVPKSEIAKRTTETLALVHLDKMANRLPASLSGGQRQRVALARAIICRPRLILLDEPLAALDVELRRQMQSFLKNIQREINTTFVFVTHDQDEAISMGDRICVMNSGSLLQIGSAAELYYRPNCEFIARFFGDNNLIPGVLAKSTAFDFAVETSIGSIQCSASDDVGVSHRTTGQSVFVSIRPEAIVVDHSDVAGGSFPNSFSGRVAAVDFSGPMTSLAVKLESTVLEVVVRMKVASQRCGLPITVGDAIRIGWRPADCHVVSAQ